MKRRALRLLLVGLVAIWLVRHPTIVAVLAIFLALGLLAGLRRYGWARWPRAGWHACEMCSTPIEPPSRARFCSPGCRRRHRLMQRAPWDDRAAGQLRALERPPSPDYGDVPF